MDADHVRLDRQREHGGEGSAEPRGSPQDDAEQGEVPGDESQHPEDAQVDAQLRVGRLAGLDLGARALRGDAGVAQPVALRVPDDGLDPVPEVVEMAVERRLVRVERAAARRLLVASLPLDLQLGRRVARLRGDVRVRADEEERGREEDERRRRPATSCAAPYASATSPTTSAAIVVRE